MILPSSDDCVFSMVIGFPVAFVNAQAMELQSGQPIVLYKCESFLFSLQMSVKTELVIFTRIKSYSVSISRSSAISRSSMNSLGMFWVTYCRSVFAKLVSSIFSKSLDNWAPGGVNRMPCGFWKKSWFSCFSVNSGSGSFPSSCLGM